jgi:hypothetical protein
MTPRPPRYWMHETTGVLRPAIMAYLAGGPMTAQHVAAMRAYLRQWIEAPGWAGPGIETLRRAIDGLTERAALSGWIEDAIEQGIDPL